MPVGRASAISRRLINRALFAPTHACSVGLLTAALPVLPPRIVSRIYRQTTSREEMLESSGVLILEMAKDLEDPDTTDAEHSAPWDLSLLMRYWHPEVQRLAIECSKSRCGENFSDPSLDAVKAIASFDGSRGGFNPVPREKCLMKRVNKTLRTNDDLDWPQAICIGMPSGTTIDYVFVESNMRDKRKGYLLKKSLQFIKLRIRSRGGLS